MKPPKNLADRYTAFFRNDESGTYLIAQIRQITEDNLNAAMDSNDLDRLSRAKGNRQVLDLIENVLKTKEAKRPKE